jgi:hypothetical protein
MSTQEKATKPPIINCHTHIFTGDHIPPFLARSIAPWPLYFLFSLRLVIKGFRFYYSKIDSLRFKPFYRKFQRWRNKVRLTINHNRGLSTLAFLVGGLLTLQVFFIIFDWLCLLQAPSESIQESVEGGRQWLIKYWLLLHPVSGFGKFVLVLLLILFFKPGRNLIFLVIKKIWSFLGALPGPGKQAVVYAVFEYRTLFFLQAAVPNFRSSENAVPTRYRVCCFADGYGLYGVGEGSERA